MRTRYVGTVVLAGGLIFALAACGAPASTGPTDDTTPPAATTDSTADVADSVRLRIAGTVGGGFTEVPIDGAVDALIAEGHDVEIVDTADPSLNIEGLARGDFDITVGDTGAALIAIQTQDAPIVTIAAGMGNPWTVYSTTDIESCEDLEGRRVAIHARVSDSTAMLNNWMSATCPGTEPEFLIIAGSGNRLAALIAGEVDASPLELSDGLALESDSEDHHLLASFAEDIPDLRPTWAVANRDFVQQQPNAVALFLAAWAEQVQMVVDDPEYLTELAERYAPELLEQETFDEAVDRYTELGVFDPTLGDEESMIEYTIGFYEDADAIEPGLEVSDVADLSILQDVVR